MRKGFTLIEVIIIFVIMMFLLNLVLGIWEKGAEAKAEHDQSIKQEQAYGKGHKDTVTDTREDW